MRTTLAKGVDEDDNQWQRLSYIPVYPFVLYSNLILTLTRNRNQMLHM